MIKVPRVRLRDSISAGLMFFFCTGLSAAVTKSSRPVIEYNSSSWHKVEIGGEERKAGGHVFIPTLLYDPSFANSHVNIETGGIYREVKFEDRVLKKDTLAGMNQTLGFGAAITESIGFKAGITGSLVTGINRQSALYHGSDGNFESSYYLFSMHWLNRRHLLTWGVKSITRQGISILLIEEQTRTASGSVKTEQKKILFDFDEWRVGASGTHTWGLNDMIGWRNFLSVTWADMTITPRRKNELNFEAKAIRLNAGGGFEFDLRRRYGLSISIPFYYLMRRPFTTTLKREGDRRLLTDTKELDESINNTRHFLESGVYYNGRPDMTLGLRFIFNINNIEDSKEKLINLRRNMTANLVLVYWF